MIDAHGIDRIKHEAEAWRLGGEQAGTERRVAVTSVWSSADSTQLSGVLAVLDESRGYDRRFATVYFPADTPVIVSRIIKARFADPFAEVK